MPTPRKIIANGCAPAGLRLERGHGRDQRAPDARRGRRLRLLRQLAPRRDGRGPPRGRHVGGLDGALGRRLVSGAPAHGRPLGARRRARVERPHALVGLARRDDRAAPEWQRNARRSWALLRPSLGFLLRPSRGRRHQHANAAKIISKTELVISKTELDGGARSRPLRSTTTSASATTRSARARATRRRSAASRGRRTARRSRRAPTTTRSCSGPRRSRASAARRPRTR